METITTAPPTQQRLKKYSRDPQYTSTRQHTTDRALTVLKLIYEYRFLPTTLACHLAGGNHHITKDHLKHLFHKGLVNRLAFPGRLNPGEFNYYLDNTDALDLLEKEGLVRFDNEGLREYARQLIRGNRKKHYDQHHTSSDQQGQLMYLHHEITISRFHAMLELGTRETKGAIVLQQWHQGPILWSSVQCPKVLYDGSQAEGQRWLLSSETEKLPHRPDAFFTLHCPELDPADQHQHFFYEHETGTNNGKKLKKKLWSHLQFVMQKKHQEVYGVPNIRAVLVETLDDKWSQTLRKAAAHPAACGKKPTPLFWFTSIGSFTTPEQTVTGSKVPKVTSLPRFLKEPLTAWDRVWQTATSDELISIIDF